MLTDAKVRALEAGVKPYKAADGGGLFIQVMPSGSRWWRFRYRFSGREKLLSLGVYPETSLKNAREKRDAYRVQLAQGLDPSTLRRVKRSDRQDTFRAVALEWLDGQKTILKPQTMAQYQRRLEKYAFPLLGQIPIKEIAAPDMLRMIQKFEAREIYETAHRVRSLCSLVFCYAIVMGRAETNPAESIRGALKPVKTQHFAALTEPKRIAELLRAIDSHRGSPIVRAALQLGVLTFVRPGELRGARWSEFDLAVGEWRIPAERMKKAREHLVPLSRQALVILRELRLLSGNGDLLFPSVRSNARPMSDNTLNAALRSLGFAAGEQTAHGFRTLASTRLNESGFNGDLIELQLAHVEQDRSRAAYNRASRMDDRREMMQWWADHLDALRTRPSDGFPETG